MRPISPGVSAGSIPVHTGKPIGGGADAGVDVVYPRTHGETIRLRAAGVTLRGLSPYTRGNLCHPMPGLVNGWSIPVHTGKPDWSLPAKEAVKVYPRTHGETHT